MVTKIIKLRLLNSFLDKAFCQPLPSPRLHFCQTSLLSIKYSISFYIDYEIARMLFSRRFAHKQKIETYSKALPTWLYISWYTSASAFQETDTEYHHDTQFTPIPAIGQYGLNWQLFYFFSQKRNPTDTTTKPKCISRINNMYDFSPSWYGVCYRIEPMSQTIVNSRFEPPNQLIWDLLPICYQYGA